MRKDYEMSNAGGVCILRCFHLMEYYCLKVPVPHKKAYFNVIGRLFFIQVLGLIAIALFSNFSMPNLLDLHAGHILGFDLTRTFGCPQIYSLDISRIGNKKLPLTKYMRMESRSWSRS